MKFTVEIVQDENPESPREWDNLGTMVCWHKRYVLGDEQPKGWAWEWLELFAESLTDPNLLDYWRERDAEQLNKLVWKILEQKVIMLPLFLYDHSGITMHTRSFSCPWDSGQVGYIFVTLEKVRREFSWKRMSTKRRERIKEVLTAEVKTYDTYLRGEVFGYTVRDGKNDVVDSCWGFYELEIVQEEAIAALRAAL